MKCTMASTLSEQTAILQQRYDIFVEEFHFLAPREDGKRVEYDAYDDQSLLLGVWEKNNLIASCRLVLFDVLGLPTLNAMKIDSTAFHKDESTAEISRITVAAGNRTFKKTRKILQTMQKEIYRISAERGIIQWIGAIEPVFLNLLNRSSLPYRPIGPLQYLIGAERYPVVLSAHDYTASLKECPC